MRGAQCSESLLAAGVIADAIDSMPDAAQVVADAADEVPDHPPGGRIFRLRRFGLQLERFVAMNELVHILEESASVSQGAAMHFHTDVRLIPRASVGASVTELAVGGRRAVGDLPGEARVPDAVTRVVEADDFPFLKDRFITPNVQPI